MKNKKTFLKAIYAFIVLIQMMLLYSGFLLNMLSVKKAGVMRHIYTKKSLYMQGIYSPDSLFIQQIVIAALLIWLLWEVISINSKKRFFKNDNNSGRISFYIFQLIIAVLLCIAVIIVMKVPVFIEMRSYPYIIMSFQIALVVQIFIVIYFKYFLADGLAIKGKLI